MNNQLQLRLETKYPQVLLNPSSEEKVRVNVLAEISFKDGLKEKTIDEECLVDAQAVAVVTLAVRYLDPKMVEVKTFESTLHQDFNDNEGQLAVFHSPQLKDKTPVFLVHRDRPVKALITFNIPRGLLDCGMQDMRLPFRLVALLQNYGEEIEVASETGIILINQQQTGGLDISLEKSEKVSDKYELVLTSHEPDSCVIEIKGAYENDQDGRYPFQFNTGSEVALIPGLPRHVFYQLPTPKTKGFYKYRLLVTSRTNQFLNREISSDVEFIMVPKSKWWGKNKLVARHVR